MANGMDGEEAAVLARQHKNVSSRPSSSRRSTGRPGSGRPGTGRPWSPRRSRATGPNRRWRSEPGLPQMVQALPCAKEESDAQGRRELWESYFDPMGEDAIGEAAAVDGARAMLQTPPALNPSDLWNDPAYPDPASACVAPAMARAFQVVTAVRQSDFAGRADFRQLLTHFKWYYFTLIASVASAQSMSPRGGASSPRGGTPHAGSGIGPSRPRTDLGSPRGSSRSVAKSLVMPERGSLPPLVSPPIGVPKSVHAVGSPRPLADLLLTGRDCS